MVSSGGVGGTIVDGGWVGGGLGVDWVCPTVAIPAVTQIQGQERPGWLDPWSLDP